MKKGCFLKFIIILTVFIAVILYIFENHFNDFILRPGESIIKDIVFKDINGRMEFVKNTPEKDSLRILINGFIHNKLHKERKLSSKEFETLTDSIKSVLADSLISNVEFNRLKSLLNERRK